MTILPSNIDTIERETYDIFISSYGYESRSTHIARSFKIKAIRRIALGFNFSHTLSYKNSRDFYKALEWEIFETSDTDFDDCIEMHILNIIPSSVLIDISSFSRLRIAKLIHAFYSLSVESNKSITIDLAYSVANYNPPSKDFPPITNVGPITPAFAGWPSDPGKPISCLIGLGYDEGRAIGAAEYLEAAQLWLFRPNGFDQRFLDSLNDANQSLIEKTGPNQIIDYRLDDPVSAYMQIHSLLWGLKQEARPLLLPFGPKIFTAISCAAAINFSPDVSVWRVSSGELEAPVDRAASGKTALARLLFQAVG